MRDWVRPSGEEPDPVSSPEENQTTRDEMCSAAIALQPQLLMRARELTGRRADIVGEDLVGDVYLALVTKPPNPKSLTQLHHWLRTVLRNQAARGFRNLHGATLESWEARQEAWARGVSTE